MALAAGSSLAARVDDGRREEEAMSTTAIPDLEMPAALRKAAELHAARAADVAETQRALREARIGIELATVEDRNAYASARDQGEADPGPTSKPSSTSDSSSARPALGSQLTTSRRPAIGVTPLSRTVKSRVQTPTRLGKRARPLAQHSGVGAVLAGGREGHSGNQ